MGNYRTEEQYTNWIGVPDGVKGGDGQYLGFLDILFFLGLIVNDNFNNNIKDYPKSYVKIRMQ